MGPTWGPPGSCRPRWIKCRPHEPCYLERHHYHWWLARLSNRFLVDVTQTWNVKTSTRKCSDVKLKLLLCFIGWLFLSYPSIHLSIVYIFFNQWCLRRHLGVFLLLFFFFLLLLLVVVGGGMVCGGCRVCGGGGVCVVCGGVIWVWWGWGVNLKWI